MRKATFQDSEIPLEAAIAMPPGGRREEILDCYEAVGYNDNEDNRFKHLIATDLGPRYPDRRQAFTSILGGFTFEYRQEWFRVPLPAFGRRLCVTEGGYIGLVPAGAKQGQSIAVLAGCSTPYVLEESSSIEGKYQLVGECYVHGAMDGEEVLERGEHSFKPVVLE